MLDAYKAVDKLADYLISKGVILPDVYKRRDPREPGRAEKELYEDKLARLLRKRFRTQKRMIADSLQWSLPKKNVGDWMDRVGDIDDPETEVLIFILFLGALAHGAELFSESVVVALDIEQFHLIASEVARTYQTKWLKALDETTLKALRSELVNFAEIPGYTIDNVVANLPFESHRVQRIATTEITRIYAEAEKIAGDLLVEDNPGIRVIKTWFTWSDEKVCIICGPLEGTSVLHGDAWTDVNGDVHFGPPAHVNCRCWMQSATDILEEVELG